MTLCRMVPWSCSYHGFRIDPHQSRPPELIARRPKTENFLVYLLEIVGGKHRELGGTKILLIVFEILFKNNRVHVEHDPTYSVSCYCY